MLFGELKCMQQTQSFIDTPSQRQIVNDLMADNALAVNKEKSSQGYSFLKKNAVVE